LKRSNNYSGRDLLEMLEVALAWLEKSAPAIDALNVFPVPDGDTGTNMLLTLRSTLEEASRVPRQGAGKMAQAMARGALMGARGNSGVIFSQIMRGIAKVLGDKDTFGARDFALALAEASALAYKGISRPVEGTMLTVMKDAAKAGQKAVGQNPTLTGVIAAASAAARDSVARTPSLLPVLAQAGVVDAGGQGLYVILEGTLHHLRGDALPSLAPPVVAPNISIIVTQPEDEEAYGYCTEFLLEGAKLDPEKIRKKLEKQGQSLMVVGDEKNIRVHIHTFDPGKVLSSVTRQGVLHAIQIRNMDDQHQAYLEMRQAQAPTLALATVVVVPGEGLLKVFQSLGASAIVPGGKTMNPSTRELLSAIEAVPSDQVVVLPNNPNVILTAKQASSLAKKQVAVVPTTSAPQGIAALLALNYEASLEANVQAMEEACKKVKTVEITNAARSSRYKEVVVKKGKPIAFLDGELVAAAPSFSALIEKLIPHLGLDGAEVITIYFGADTKREQADEIAGLLRRHFTGEMEVVDGKQPHYNYIISIE
jgi:DAK2 domain fusion protein YloV